ncbi:vitamin K epoxide reductase [Thecamonas trahens ATCC 50062]|uniref:Vitamin K epoxide reductase n=1 Tax=Thecamonas trahens ATCC 50062 TaxID=461836 RepID=A0A0L0D7Q5_THETB|nr:vitamin K epoxide reductase [Thecamonas trahens ATCC 50062]KNC48389.1 vitamin K epoxide reductase [Thecamonas trahens ATCC 50062]|eukprot:XP_013758506.1 vitamin K epoxide reductase [Thecamonas trahens ATCC 50062]
MRNPLVLFSEEARVRVLAVVGLVGMATSVYLLRMHYAPEVAAHGVCEVNSVLSCVAVNTSKYSELFKIPVALLGIFWFAVVTAVAAHLVLVGYDTAIVIGLAGWSATGAATVVYLVAAELALGKICLACTLVQFLSLAVMALAHSFYITVVRPRRSLPDLVDLVAELKWWLVVIVCVGLIMLVACNAPATVLPAAKEHRAELVACLNARAVAVYWYAECSHCVRQRARFGLEWSNIQASHECTAEAETCKLAKIEATPTWVRGDSRHQGMMELDELAKWAGCAWPSAPAV